MKKKWTDEERQAWGAKMRAAKQAKLNQKPIEPAASTRPKEERSDKQPYEALQAQIDEIMESNALLKAALLNKDRETKEGASITSRGVIGEVDKYLVDPENYPDPTRRLAAETKLVQALNFPYNYELQYKFSVRPYETKAGVNMREPEFMVQLNRIVLDEQGEQTDKRYVARRLIFHEDPQAALVVARDNNIEIDQSDQKAFLDEMRYLRVRDWLFDIFWPKSIQEREKITEEVIGGTIVQVFTKSSLDPAEIPFDQLKTKMV